MPSQFSACPSACQTSDILLGRNIYVKHIIQPKIIFDKNTNRLAHEAC